MSLTPPRWDTNPSPLVPPPCAAPAASSAPIAPPTAVALPSLAPPPSPAAPPSLPDPPPVRAAPLAQLERPTYPPAAPQVAGQLEPVNRATGIATSLIVHMVLVIALGLWLYAVEPHRPRISLSISMDQGQGASEGDAVETAPEITAPDTAPLAELLDPQAIRDDVDPFSDQATPLDSADQQLSATIAESGPLAGGGGPKFGDRVTAGGLGGRGAAMRGKLVHGGGGSDASEAAVRLGLRWLARHQFDDGHWGLDNFAECPSCKGRCTGAGGHSDVAATGLALLPFLGAGHTSLEGEYSTLVHRGLEWLVRNQGPQGDLRGRGEGRMYAHGQATIVLCEAYAMTQEEWLRDAAQKAVDFIVFAQNENDGGWRYTPRQPGDTSVLGWQVMALRSAQMAYLNVPPQTLERASHYLDQAQCDNYGGLYSYQPGGGPTPTMTAEALLCRMYGGWQPDHPGVMAGVQYVADETGPQERNLNIYYWYYATQLMHHYGGPRWESWNRSVRDTLIALQQTRGHEAGSWDPGGPLSATGGRLYMTSMAVCTLEVYYRHLPLFRQSAVDR